MATKEGMPFLVCRLHDELVDMHLPSMSGLAATEYIMAHCPTPIVYGMPLEAALLGAAERILPLGEIGTAVAEYWR